MKIECAERLTRIECSLVDYNRMLDQHMKRTEQNEKAIEEFKKFQWKILGMASIIGPILGFALNHYFGK
jgi:hypothetical protein